MAVSDRDKKIIYFMLIIMVVCLPYFFFIKNKKIETGAVQAEVDTLQARYDELQEMNLHRQDYIDETEEMNKKRDAIIAQFPSDIVQANYTMFLLKTEYSGEYVNDENGNRVRKMPIWFDAVTYGQNIETAISSVDTDTDTGLTGLTNSSTVSYETNYYGLKYLLAYFMEYEDPMIYTKFTMDYDEETGHIAGELMLAQYAVAGNDRPAVPPTDYTITVDGMTVDVNIDDMNMRGNTDEELNGVFGPRVVTGLISDEDAAEAGEADADNGEAENASDED